MELLCLVWLFATPWSMARQAYSVRGIIQARILKWVAILFYRGSPWPRDWTQASCIAGRFFTVWVNREAPLPLYPIPYQILLFLCVRYPWIYPLLFFTIPTVFQAFPFSHMNYLFFGWDFPFFIHFSPLEPSRSFWNKYKTKYTFLPFTLLGKNN